MPHAIWTGAVSFGLVTIPIRVTAATEDHSVRFHQFHQADGGRVRVRKVCELEDREVDQNEIGKGYEWSKDRVIPVTEGELAAMPLPTAKAIEVLGFVPYESIDPIRIGEGYYLEADGVVASKPYVLLRKALARSSKAAVVKFAWHGRERLGLLRVRDDALVLHAMRWDDEIRDSSELAPEHVELSEEEFAEALRLIDGMALGGLESAEYRDEYTDALRKVIEAKREGRSLPEAPESETAPTEVVDLMVALQESVDKAKASRGEVTGKQAPAKKTAVRKSTAARKPRRSA